MVRFSSRPRRSGRAAKASAMSTERGTIVERLVWGAGRRPALVFVVAAVGTVLGALSFQDLQQDVFPDLSAPVFNVIVQNPAMSAEELETAIAVPLETALAGLANVRRIRSNNQL